MIMITINVYKEFELLWRRHVFDVNLTYGQALAQYSLCSDEDPASSFLHTSSYPVIKVWIEEQISAHQQTQAATDTGNKAIHPRPH
jgi:hypothetical protein